MELMHLIIMCFVAMVVSNIYIIFWMDKRLSKNEEEGKKFLGRIATLIETEQAEREKDLTNISQYQRSSQGFIIDALKSMIVEVNYAAPKKPVVPKAPEKKKK